MSGRKGPPDQEGPGERNEKLIRRKKEWARIGRHQSGADAGAAARRRLPPGQRQTNKWPVLDLGEQPNISPKDWTLTVGGRVGNPIAWSWNDFRAQPQVTISADIHCVTAWSLVDSRWQGVSALHLLAVVKPAPEAKFLVFHAYDGYTTNVPLDRFAVPEALLVHAWNGESLSREHGGPVRVVIPQLYFWKSAKWLKYIYFSDKDTPGYWEARGYHNVGDPWNEERYG